MNKITDCFQSGQTWIVDSFSRSCPCGRFGLNQEILVTCANINKIKIFRCFLLGGCLIVSEVFHGSLENDLREGNQLAEDEPVVDHFGVGGGGQALHLADEDCRHHQHGGQVHTEGRLKEESLEKGRGKSDQREQ